MILCHGRIRGETQKAPPPAGEIGREPPPGSDAYEKCSVESSWVCSVCMAYALQELAMLSTIVVSRGFLLTTQNNMTCIASIGHAIDRRADYEHEQRADVTVECIQFWSLVQAEIGGRYSRPRGRDGGERIIIR